MPLHVNLLGTFAVKQDETPVTNFRSDKVRGMLAYLVIEANRAHQRSAIATMLWSESDETKALKNLRSSLSNLKSIVDNDDILSVTRQQIQIVLNETVFVDVLAFEQLIADCEVHQHANVVTCEACIGRYRQAIDLYRGDFLTGFALNDSDGFNDWQTIQSESLHNQVLHALHTVIAHEERAGDAQQLQATANRLLSFTPWSEVAHRALMSAFAMKGDRTAALHQYDQCAQILSENIGVEPNEETQTLARMIRDGSPLNVFRKASTYHNLPQVGSLFVGREQELPQLSKLVMHETYRLITLVGAGGIGKTRLAIAVGKQLLDEFADGVYFVSIESLTRHATDLGVARALADGMSFTLDESKLFLPQLVEILRHKQQLIIFDNCEHLVNNESFITLVQTLLSETQQVRLMLTSRQPFGLQIESIFRLSGLSLPDSMSEDASSHGSVRLFVERAQRVDTLFAFTADDLPIIVDICQLVDGIPLAIELAAASLDRHTLAQLSQTLREDVDVLATTMRDVPERHRTLRTVFDYSWRLLTSEEKHVLMQLSIFQGGFDAEAYQTVVKADPAILASLVSKSLLTQHNESNHVRRYRLLDTVRQYAAQQVETETELAESRARHVTYYLTFLAGKTAGFRGIGQQNTITTVGQDIGNIRQAWSYAVAFDKQALLLDAIDGLHQFYDMRSWYKEGTMAMRQVIELLKDNKDANQMLLGKALARCGWFRFLLGEHEAGKAEINEGRILLQRNEYWAEIVFCLNYLSAIEVNLSNLDPALTHAHHALEMAQTVNDQHGAMIAHNLQGRVHFLRDDYGLAQSNYNWGLTLAQQNGNRWSTAFSLEYLGQLALKQLQADEAQRLFARSLAIRQQMNDRRGVGFCYIGMGDVAQQQGRADEAEELYRRALGSFTKVGNLLGIAKAQQKIDFIDLGASLNFAS